MKRSWDRFISIGLVLIILLTSVMPVYGATPSGSSAGDGTYNPGNWPGYGDNPTPSNDHWGVRLSVTNMTQAGASNIAPIELGAPYTDAINQFNDLAELLKKKVWMPGDYGIKSNQARKGKFSFLAIPIFGDISFQVRAVKDKPCFFKILDSSHFLG